MVELALIEQQILDKYDSLKKYSGGHFDKNTVTHLMLNSICSQLENLDFKPVEIVFTQISEKKEEKRRSYTVTREYELEKKTTPEERLIVGSMPIAYEGDVDAVTVFDRTLQVFEELGLKPTITSDIHFEEVKRRGNLNMYVIDENSGLTVQVMDDSKTPRLKWRVIPFPIRYGELLQKQKELSPEEFKDYVVKVEKPRRIIGPVFRYDRESQILAEDAMMLFALIGRSKRAKEVLMSEKDPQEIKLQKNLVEKVNSHLTEFRDSL